MSANTNIEWTDHTFNPWWGCQKAGPGCDHCYAETLDKRTGGQHWGPGAERRRTSVKNWNDPVRWNAKADAFFAKHGRRQRVFCASMGDVFDNAVDPQWRIDLFKLIEATPNLDWLLLTKRIGNVLKMVQEGNFFPSHWPNVWLGATIVNQDEADRDIPKLLAVPAHKRFLSMEPLLGPVDLTRIDVWNGDAEIYPLTGTAGCVDDEGEESDDLPAIDWVIVGGESGPGARPMHPGWARSLRDQCDAAGVPFLFKQWGGWIPVSNLADGTVEPVEEIVGNVEFADGQRVKTQWLSPNGGVVGYPMAKIGKKAAGRLLDGRTWDGYPA